MKKFILVLRFLVAPVSSWEIETKGEHSPAVHEKGWFYPLLAIAGATSFVQMLYGSTLTEALIRGIAMFTAFFLGYMLAPMLASLLVKHIGTQRAKAVTESDLKVLTMFVYSIGLIVAIVQNLLPAPMTPLYIFLVYMLFVLSKCAPLFGADSDNGKMLFVFGMFSVFLAVPVVVLCVIFKFIPQESI